MANCIIWDWNGTLLDDVDAAVGALNRMLALRGVAPTTRAFYRAHFGFPVRPFYAALGVDLAREDWDAICVDFHRFIEEEPGQRLRPDAAATLGRASALGFRQFILSALREDLLRRGVAAAGVAGSFEEIFGVDNLDGATKVSRGLELMARLRETGGMDRCFFVGDTLHDAEVAAELGAECVLVGCGHQEAGRLASAGVPVADSLTAAFNVVMDRIEG